MVQDETDRYFADQELIDGFGPEVRDRYLRTLVRNSYNYHLNEIFATVQNEYTDWMAWTPPSSGMAPSETTIRPRHLQKLASQVQNHFL